MTKIISVLFIFVSILNCSSLKGEDKKSDLPEILVKIGNAKITKDDFLTRLVEKYGYGILENLIVEKLVEVELNSKGLDPINEKQIDVYLDRVTQHWKSTMGPKAELRTMLKNQNMTMYEFRKKLKRELGLRRILGKTIDVTEKEKREHYKAMEYAYKEPKSRQVIDFCVLHKFSPVPDHMKVELSKEDAQKRAEAILTQLKKDDKLMESIAKEKGLYVRGMDDARPFAIADTAKERKDRPILFKSHVNSYSEVEEDDVGFHVYKIIKDRLERQRPYEEVEKEISNALVAKKVGDAIKKGFFNEIKSKYKVDYKVNLKPID